MTVHWHTGQLDDWPRTLQEARPPGRLVSLLSKRSDFFITLRLPFLHQEGLPFLKGRQFEKQVVQIWKGRTYLDCVCGVVCDVILVSYSSSAARTRTPL